MSCRIMKAKYARLKRMVSNDKHQSLVSALIKIERVWVSHLHFVPPSAPPSRLSPIVIPHISRAPQHTP